MMPKKEVDSEIKDKVAKVCKEVVLQEEIAKLKQQIQQQLVQAKQQLIRARQQVNLWEVKIHQLSGSFATCNAILEKSQKAKVLELEGDNIKPRKK